MGIFVYSSRRDATNIFSLKRDHFGMTTKAQCRNRGCNGCMEGELGLKRAGEREREREREREGGKCREWGEDLGKDVIKSTLS